MARRPIWLVTYEGRDISAEIAPMVTSMTYTDHVHGKSDEVEFTVEDGDRRWRELWYPSEGDRIELRIGYYGEPLLPCGAFTLDEVEMPHSPRTTTIRGLAVPLSTPLRSKESIAYDGVTLRGVVYQVAARYGLTVVGEIEPLPFRRITQADQTSLQFLRRLAEEYGYAFSIRGTQLVFFNLLSLEAEPSAFTLRPIDLLAGTSLKGSAQHTYVACEVSYFDPETGEVLRERVEAPGIRRTTGPHPVEGASPAPVVAPDVVLRYGSPHKDEVRDWQSFLQGRSMYREAIDGIFGQHTYRGTKSFQSEQGIGVDGVVGPITYAAAIAVGFGSTTEQKGGTSAVGDVLYIKARVESAAEAQAKARAALHRANRLRASGSMVLEGTQQAVSGATVDVVDYGRLAGKYLIDKSVHTITRGVGYRTEVEVASAA